MLPSWFPLVLIALLLGLALFLGLWSVRMFLRKQSTPGPRQAKQITRVALPLTILIMAIILWLGMARPGVSGYSYLMCVPLAVISIYYAWSVFHAPTEGESLENFARNRQLCGRCGYSLVGNVSGICPECAWVIPTGAFPSEEPNWSAWWHQWRIRYIRNWVWHLCTYVGFGLFFLVLAVVFWFEDQPGSAILVGLLGTHLSINAFRVISYLFRRRAEKNTGMKPPPLPGLPD